MKKLITVYCSLITALALSILPARAATYSITNDLSSAFTFFYWTNNNGSYVFSLTNTLAPTIGTNVTVLTNGVAGLGVQSTNGTMSILVPWTNVPIISVFGSALFNDALVTIQPASETVPQTQNILRSYYITGAVPTQANYWEWIDTMYYYFSQFGNNMAQNPTAASLNWQLNPLLSPAVSVGNTNFISSISFLIKTNSGSRLWFFTNYFSSLLNNNTYIAVNAANNLGLNSGGNPIVVLDQEPSFCAFAYTNSVSTTNAFYSYFIFYK